MNRRTRSAIRAEALTRPTAIDKTQTSKKSRSKLRVQEEANPNDQNPAPVNELMQVIANFRKAEEEAKSRFVSIDEVRELQKSFKQTIECAKRETEQQERKRTTTKPSRTRSGLKRGAPILTEEYTQGKLIVKGMDDAREEFDHDELEYLEKEVAKVKNVHDLKFVHLKYLIKYKFHDDLRRIKEGYLESEFHDRFMALKGECINELRSEIRTSLFKSEQRDYINGLLQEIFKANQKDENGDIKHFDISYVETVMVYETVLRIVGLIHNIKDNDELLMFLEAKSRIAFGISDDEE